MAYDETHLANLLCLAQKGDRQAYKEFLTTILPLVSSQIKKKVFNKDDFSDVTQEVLLSIHKALATYDSKRSAIPWIFAITDRRIVDYIRKTTRKNKEETLSTDGDVTLLAVETNSTETALPAEAHKILSMLPEEARRAIELTKIDGLSTREAAEMLGIQENALRTRVSRAMAQLRDILKEDGHQ